MGVIPIMNCINMRRLVLVMISFLFLADFAHPAWVQWDKTHFNQRKITWQGSFQKDITSVVINGKKARLNKKNQTWEVKLDLKLPQNSITIVAKKNKNVSKKYFAALYYDTQSPQISFASLPKKTNQKTLHVTGLIQEQSLASVIVCPSADFKSFKDSQIGSNTFTGRLYLKEGKNNFFIVAVDSAGNTSQKNFTIEYAQSQRTPILAKPAAQPQKKAPVKSTQKPKPSPKQPTPIVEKKLEAVATVAVPRVAGIYLLPFLGKSYRSAASRYLESESFATLLASFNGQEQQYLKEILIPSPNLFTLLDKTKQKKDYYKVLQYASTQFLKNNSFVFVEAQVLKFLLKNNLVRNVHEQSNFNIFELANNSAVIFLKGNTMPNNKGLHKEQKNLTEVILVQVFAKSMVVRKW